jgi:hypothetical protein
MSHLPLSSNKTLGSMSARFCAGFAALFPTKDLEAIGHFVTHHRLLIDLATLKRFDYAFAAEPEERQLYYLETALRGVRDSLAPLIAPHAKAKAKAKATPSLRLSAEAFCAGYERLFEGGAAFDFQCDGELLGKINYFVGSHKHLIALVTRVKLRQEQYRFVCDEADTMHDAARVYHLYMVLGDARDYVRTCLGPA